MCPTTFDEMTGNVFKLVKDSKSALESHNSKVGSQRAARNRSNKMTHAKHMHESDNDVTSR